MEVSGIFPVGMAMHTHAVECYEGEGGVEVGVSTHAQDYTNIFTLQTTFQHEQCGQRPRSWSVNIYCMRAGSFVETNLHSANSRMQIL